MTAALFARLAGLRIVVKVSPMVLSAAVAAAVAALAAEEVEVLVAVVVAGELFVE
jgi:hypothetical protein